MGVRVGRKRVTENLLTGTQDEGVGGRGYHIISRDVDTHASNSEEKYGDNFAGTARGARDSRRMRTKRPGTPTETGVGDGPGIGAADGRDTLGATATNADNSGEGG